MIETRTFAASLEVRQDGDGRTVSGLAAPYNKPTRIGSRYSEMFVPGSFDLSGGGVPLHAGHDSELPVSPPGQFHESADGLHGQWRVSPTTQGDDLITLIKDGAAGDLSVGFSPNEQRDQWDASGMVTRFGAKLFHVAVVERGAYPQAKVLSVRDGKEPYGPVEYADPGLQPDGKKRYPVDTADHVHAAWAYISKAQNAAKYSPGDLAKVKAAIKTAAKGFGIKIGSDTSPRAAVHLLECRASLYARQRAGGEPWRGVTDARLAQSFLAGRK
jgi:HK97 family phage prohead protease